jgi:triacylglycerol lipase
MSVPANRSQMPVGRKVIVPVLTHAWMLTDIRSLASVAEALAIPLQGDRQFERTQHSQKSLQNNGSI